MKDELGEKGDPVTGWGVLEQGGQILSRRGDGTLMLDQMSTSGGALQFYEPSSLI